MTLQYKTEQHLVTATWRVGFEVYEGERFVVLGPSGCGKSTLLKAVAGFMQPVEGLIRLAGKQIDKPGSDRMMVFQEFDQLLPWKTVLGNVLFPLLVNRRMPKAEATEHARSVIAKVNLTRFENVHPHMLSGGMSSASRSRARSPGAEGAADGRAVRRADARRGADAGGLKARGTMSLHVLFAPTRSRTLLVAAASWALARIRRVKPAERRSSLRDIGTPAFEKVHRRIHDLLFADRIETELAAETPNG